MCEQKPYPVLFRAGTEAIRLSVNIAESLK